MYVMNIYVLYMYVLHMYVLYMFVLYMLYMSFWNKSAGNTFNNLCLSEIKAQVILSTIYSSHFVWNHWWFGISWHNNTYEKGLLVISFKSLTSFSCNGHQIVGNHWLIAKENHFQFLGQIISDFDQNDFKSVAFTLGKDKSNTTVKHYNSAAF